MRVWAAVLTGLVLGTAYAGPVSAAPSTASVGLVVGVRGALDELPSAARETGTLPGAVTIDVPQNRVASVAAALRDDPAVAYVEPDHIATTAVVTTPNDSAYASQWGIAKTRVNAAWSATRGSASVTVAVVDTGVSRLADFGTRILPGRDFVNDDAKPDDDNGHGTMAAGVIAAGGNNGTGVAGICWYCKILPVKVLGKTGSGSYSDIAEGIRYAADQGADIINLSLGGGSDSQLLRDAVAYAISKKSLVIAAAGNAGSSALHFPAAFSGVLAVGASTPGDGRYPWSNHGANWVDLAAPGCNYAQNHNGLVNNFCGTSSATPFAAGVAALLASTSPAPAPAAIRTAMTASATKLAGNWVAATSGRVDAASALGTVGIAGADRAAPAVAFTAPAASATVHGAVLLGGAASDDTGIARVELFHGSKRLGTRTAAPYAFRWASTGYNGWITLQLRAYDRVGNVTIARRTLWVDNTGPALVVAQAAASGTKRIARSAPFGVRATDPAGIHRLDLYVNGRIVQQHAGAAYTFSVPTYRYGPVVRVQVRAVDRLGNARLTPTRTWYR